MVSISKGLGLYVFIFILVLATAGLYAGMSNSKPLPAKLRNRCLQVMGRGDCIIMHNAAYLPKEIQQIFISGYGNLSAKTYRDLKNSGIFMCDQIQESCATSEQAEICRLGQAIYQ